MKTQYKYLVLSDLDGTLLDSHGLLSKRTIDYVHKLNKEGSVLFSFSTGRCWEDAKEIYDSLQLKGFVSCCNSGLIYDPHKNFSLFSLISEAIWSEILGSKLMLKHLVKGKILSDKLSLSFDLSNAYQVRDKLLEKGALVYGIKMYFNYSDQSPELDQDLFEKVSFMKKFESKPSISVFYYPGLLNLEIQANYVNKERAVEFLGNYYNISPMNILTFGDNHNDLSVMQGKSNSFAVRNSIDLIKKAAKNFSKYTNNEDSVVRELEIFFSDKKL